RYTEVPGSTYSAWASDTEVAIKTVAVINSDAARRGGRELISFLANNAFSAPSAIPRARFKPSFLMTIASAPSIRNHHRARSILVDNCSLPANESYVSQGEPRLTLPR